MSETAKYSKAVFQKNEIKKKKNHLQGFLRIKWQEKLTGILTIHPSIHDLSKEQQVIY